MKVVAFVPIKLNSQRVKNKNILPLGNHPLCWHICDTLNQVSKIDDVIVYCSDENVLKYIPSKTKFLKRPKELDQDLVKGSQIYKSFIESVDADIYILAHTTSPFTKKETIENALNHVLNDKFDSSFSAKRVQTFAWFNGKPINYNLNDVPRTQDIQPVYIETSGFYIFRKELFLNHNRRIGFNPYIQEVDEFESIDIDEPTDYEYACQIMKLLEDNEI